MLEVLREFFDGDEDAACSAEVYEAVTAFIQSRRVRHVKEVVKFRMIDALAAALSSAATAAATAATSGSVGNATDAPAAAAAAVPDAAPAPEAPVVVEVDKEKLRTALMAHLDMAESPSKVNQTLR